MKTYMYIIAGLISLSACQTKSGETTEQTQKTESSSSEATFQKKSFDISTLPKDLPVVGDVVNGASWQDKEGLFTLVLTELPPKKEKDEEGNEEATRTEAHGYLFKVENEKYTLLQQADIVEWSPLDVKAEIMSESVLISDSNGDNTGEATFIIRHYSKGDVSPSSITLTTFEGKDKYQIKGNMLYTVEKGTPEAEMFPNGIGGEKDDSGFKNAPESLKKQANELWEKFHKVPFGTD